MVGIFLLFTIIWCCLRRHNIHIIELPDIVVKPKYHPGDDDDNFDKDGSLRSVDYTDSAFYDSRLTNGIGKTDDTEQLIPSGDGKRCLCHSCYVARNNTMKSSDDRDYISESFNSNTEDVSAFKTINNASNVSFSQTYRNNNESETPSESSPLHRYLNLPASEEDRSTDDKTLNDVIKNESIDPNTDIVELQEESQDNKIIVRNLDDDIKNPSQHINDPSGTICNPNGLFDDPKESDNNHIDSTNDSRDSGNNSSGLSNSQCVSLRNPGGIVNNDAFARENHSLLNNNEEEEEGIQIGITNDVLDIINNIADDVVANERTYES